MSKSDKTAVTYKNSGLAGSPVFTTRAQFLCDQSFRIINASSGETRMRNLFRFYLGTRAGDLFLAEVEKAMKESAVG